MFVVIRADASQTIGSGHVMRCLTLAEQLRLKGAEVSFICRDIDGNLAEYIRGKGFEVHLLARVDKNKSGLESAEMFWLGTDWRSDSDQTKAVLEKSRKVIDWMIIDHYGIDYKWQFSLRDWVHNIMVIDDLANRRHDCDILLDQNLFENPSLRYLDLVSINCRRLLGPHYALLRAEFSEARSMSLERDGQVQRLMVFYGGSDPLNETLRTLRAVESLSLNIDVIVGSINPNIEKVKKFVLKQKNMSLYCNVANIAQLMIKADLAVGASGGTTWERCCLGLPMILLSIAENQVDIAKNLERHQCAVYLGKNTEVTDLDIYRAVRYFIDNPSKVRELSQNSSRLVDGHGAERVGNILLSYRRLRS